MTYEKALSLYKLEMSEDIARSKVNSLKRVIKDLGMVNLGAIEEYERVSSRYEFLIKQRDDLVSAENTLLEIISEMDKVMENDFKSTFDIVNKMVDDSLCTERAYGRSDTVGHEHEKTLCTVLNFLRGPHVHVKRS